MPPPTPTSTSPARIAASSTPAARTPEAQTLLIVSEETSFGIPALICAWREGIWPAPACSTWPITTCCDLLGRDAGALERGLDGDAAELGGLRRTVRRRACRLGCGRRRGSRSWAWDVTIASGHGGPRHHRRPARHRRRHDRRRRLRRQGRCRTTSRTARSARWWTSGEARSAFRKLAHTHAAGRRWILVGLGARDDFDAERARVAAAVALGRARELGARSALLGAAAQGRRRRRRRARRGHAAGRLPLPRASRASRATDRAPEALVVSAHHDVAAPVEAGRAGAEAANRARDLGNAPANTLTPEALAARARELDGVAGRGRWGGRRSRRPAWARSPRSRRAPTTSRS